MFPRAARGSRDLMEALAREIAELTSRPLRAAGLASETDPNHAGDRPSPGDDPLVLAPRRSGGGGASPLRALEDRGAMAQRCAGAISADPAPLRRLFNRSLPG